jgi:hypothetical protein
LGLPLLGYARRLFTSSLRIMFPGTAEKVPKRETS